MIFFFQLHLSAIWWSLLALTKFHLKFEHSRNCLMTQKNSCIRVNRSNMHNLVSSVNETHRTLMSLFKLENTYKCAPVASATPASKADAADEFDVKWIVCSSLSPISEPLLKLFLRFPWPPVDAVMSPKNRTIDVMIVQNSFHKIWREIYFRPLAGVCLMS